MDRRGFITYAGLFGLLGLTTKASIPSAISADGATNKGPCNFLITIKLPKNMSFAQYTQVRNKKMNFGLFNEIEKQFIQTGKIKSKNFAFLGDKAELLYVFASGSVREEFINFLKKDFQASERFVSDYQIELKLDIA